MDDRRFDALTKRLAGKLDRRAAIKGLLGLAGIGVVGSLTREDEVRAARRPTPTPQQPSCPGNQIPCGSGCCCPSGSESCGATCCVAGESVCCNGACCDAICTPDGGCCPEPRTCFGACCADGQRCCLNGFGCVPASGCCGDDECPDGRCIFGSCVPNTPTSIPSDTPTSTNIPATSTSTPTTAPTNTATSSPTPTPTRTTAPPTNTPSRTPTRTPTRTPGPPRIFLERDDRGGCNYWVVVENFEPNRSYSFDWRGGSMWMPCTGSGSIFTNAAGDGRGFVYLGCGGWINREFTFFSPFRRMECNFSDGNCNNPVCRTFG